MRKTFLPVLLIFCVVGLKAQKSDLFTYDRDRVGTIMEQINKTTATPGEFNILIPDTSQTQSKINPRFFFIGMASACLVVPLPIILLLNIESTASTTLAVLTTITLGMVVPTGIVGLKTHDLRKTSLTFIGSLTGMACDYGTIWALYAIAVFLAFSGD